MEATRSVKSVVVASNQYRNNGNDVNLIQLQRQLDVLISITHKGASLTFFDAKDLLCTDCLAGLVEILNDPNIKQTLVQKIIHLFKNLANKEELRNCLHCTYHLTGCLAGLLKTQIASVSDPLGMTLLKLLQKITYGQKVTYEESYADDLVQFLIKNIQGKDNELTVPCLGLMANLCRQNFSMQRRIKNMENIKKFYQKLMSYLSHGNSTIIVFSLSLLSSLCLYDDLGEQIFSAEHINQIFQLMFNIMVKRESPASLQYVVDVFTDIVKHTKIQRSLAIYQYLGDCLNQVLSLLSSTDMDIKSITKVFELLLSFCAVDGIRCSICKTFLEPGPDSHQPFEATVKWAEQPTDTCDTAPLLALDFMREMYEEMLDLGLLATISPRTDLVLPVLTETLMRPMTQQQDDASIKKQCNKIVRALKLLISLCSDDALKSQVARSIDTKVCKQIVEHQLGKNKLGIKATRREQDLQDWSEDGADVVLYSLDLMLQIKRTVNGMEGLLNKVLQDQRLVNFLAFGMTSDCRERVHISVRLISHGTGLEDFPYIVLGECIAATNARFKRHKEDSSSSSTKDYTPSLPPPAPFHPVNNKENVPFANVSRANNKTSADLETSVQGLIEKMESGMELKDVKNSDFINVYEHKIQSLQTKENHLQDLLEAKAMALTQADRLIAQLRCRNAQAEAEGAKLRSLLQEYERRGEDSREKLNQITIEREKMQTDIEQLAQDNARLESIADDFKDLTQSYADQSQRLENAQRSLQALKQEHQTMSEMHGMLQRHNETLKQQHDVASQQLAELEEERKGLSKQLKEKESKLHESNRSLKKTDEKLTKVEKERDELETTIDKLRTELGKTEKTKKELQHQVSTLELVCQQHETSIKEKDSQIRNQNLELEKHKDMANMIHKLTGGK